LHTYVLDSCVSLLDPFAVLAFEDNTVILPLASIEECDRMKGRNDSVGKHSRMFSRVVDELRERGSLLEGVKTDNGGIVKVQPSIKSLLRNLPDELAHDMADNAILAVAIEVEGILVTNDLNLRIKADALGVKAQPYATNRVNHSELYEGSQEVIISGEEMAMLFSGGIDLDRGFYENECLTLRCQSNLNQTALGIYKEGRVNAIANYDDGICRIKPQNREQHFGLELLMDDSLPLVTLNGSAGTGKTLLSLAAGLAKVQEGVYSRMLVARPVTPLGSQDIGFLPGSAQEKVDPWMAPVYDNLDVIFGSKDVRKNVGQNGYKGLIEQGLLQVEPLSFIRGRSIPKQIFIIDEAQNLSTLELKTIITRAGEGTKIVLIGDCQQCDSPYMDASSNGLSRIIESFKSEKLAGHITLTKGERSPLSELAARIL
jgi:PhoH-like ATPase